MTSVLLISLVQLGGALLIVTVPFLLGAFWQAARANTYLTELRQLRAQQRRTPALRSVAPDDDLLEQRAAEHRQRLRRQLLDLTGDEALAAHQ